MCVPDSTMNRITTVRDFYVEQVYHDIVLRMQYATQRSGRRLRPSNAHVFYVPVSNDKRARLGGTAAFVVCYAQLNSYVRTADSKND